MVNDKLSVKCRSKMEQNYNEVDASKQVIPRTKPYHTTQANWKQILSNTNIIPIDQYIWDNENEINAFLNKLFDMYKNKKYFGYMGRIIYYTGIPEGKEVCDGEHKLITIILILNAISKVCNSISIKTKDRQAKSFAQSIVSNLIEDIYSMPEPTKIVKDFKENSKFADYTKIPKILCINPLDYEALCDIHNTYELITASESDDSDNDGESDDSDSESNDGKMKNTYTKIYSAYEFITDAVNRRFSKISELKNFYQFIMNDIDLTVCECSDLKYLSTMFI